MDGLGNLKTNNEKEIKESESEEEKSKDDVELEVGGESDQKIAEMLQLSQAYMEKNCNAACNNLSLLTLHAFEMGSYLKKR